MRMAKTGNSRYLREMNQARVLDIIRTREGVSRIGLAEATGLSATAVGVIVKSLLEDQYIHETGEGVSSGGRKPTLLQLRPRSWYGIGIDVDARFLYLSVLDHAGQVVWQKRQPGNGAVDPANLLERAVSLYQEALRETRIPKIRILGLGISVPGIVEREGRRIAFAPNLGWKDVAVREPLADRLGLPVYVENESVCSTICEQWIGSCRDVEDFLHVNIDTGIGAGLFLKGSLYRGTAGSAGEVGHIVVDDEGPQCTCGNRGCLETLASLDGMVRQAGSDSFEAFLTSVRAGEPAAVAVMDRASRSLGRAVSMLVNTLNPRRIVLGKRFPEYADLALQTVVRQVKKEALNWPESFVEVVPGSYGEESSSYGAAILPIRQLMQP
jgi:predicted NBD/HSP70 family sugar kinase